MICNVLYLLGLALLVTAWLASECAWWPVPALFGFALGGLGMLLEMARAPERPIEERKQ